MDSANKNLRANYLPSILIENSALRQTLFLSSACANSLVLPFLIIIKKICSKYE